jgi:selenide,water dikinase
MTDVTGFGLLGHGLEVCRGSGIGARIAVADVPLLHRAAELAQADCRTGAAVRNWQSYGDEVDLGGASDWQRDLLCDPQTSGGLLVAVSPQSLGTAMDTICGAGFLSATVIGEMRGEAPGITLA